MKKTPIIIIFSLLLSEAAFTQVKSITAAMGKVKLVYSHDDLSSPIYSVTYDNKPVVTNSKLGFRLVDAEPLDKGFSILNTEIKDVDEDWKPVWGEVNHIRNHYQQLTVHLRQDKTQRLMDLIFRVFADGVGFRYQFPKQAGLKYFVIADELTTFNMAGNHKTFWIPGDYDSNEYPYTISKIGEINNVKLVNSSTDIAVRVAPDKYAVQTPLMMKTDDGLYINIHEAALVDFAAMQLHVDTATYSFTASLVPDAVGNKGYVHAPGKTPWRTVIVSDKATEILASKLILNLNEPCAIGNIAYIKPMKFVGVWWEMQTAKGTWSYANDADLLNPQGQLIPNGTHSANTANVKRYIDFASRNGIQGVLVEGWNVGWEDWFGNWKEHVFSFVTPYPDFNINEITNYAKLKGAKMIMHNETSGSATDYERQMEDAFKFMNKFGYPAVKTGYVGRIIPRGEHHDGQWMVNHYVRVVQKAAQHQVMLDAHEPVRPTGLQRTYPNWMACEAGRGNEYNAFSNGNNPDHETIMPFTRLMGGPMDYTPGIFKIKNYGNNPERQVHTTLAKQLALYVTFYSPLQMAADLPSNYEKHMDAFQFIKDVPTDWDDTKVLEAEPGEYITMARKGKGTPTWFLGAVTNAIGRTTNVPLTFLDSGKKYTATIYVDADNADWKNNPEAYKITKLKVDNKSMLNITLANGGGAAVSITLDK